jgi:hypothetical protein
MTVFLFCLAVIGITAIIVDGTVFDEVRDWLATKLPEELCDVFTCHQCMGTWVGLGCGLILNTSFWGTTVTLLAAAVGAVAGWKFLKRYHPKLVVASTFLGFFIGSAFLTENVWVVLLSGGAGAFLAPFGNFLTRYMSYKVELVQKEFLDAHDTASSRGDKTFGDGSGKERTTS